jgi:hypothetical protein
MRNGENQHVRKLIDGGAELLLHVAHTVEKNKFNNSSPQKKKQPSPVTPTGVREGRGRRRRRTDNNAGFAALLY